MVSKLIVGFCCIFLLNLLFLPSAHAYIDPGTGTMLLQLLAACGVAIMLFGKKVYYFIRGLFIKADSGDTQVEK